MTAEHCINCRTTVGMSSSSARGYWEGDRYLGGLCANCVFYPERISPAVLVRLNITRESAH